VSIVFQQTCQAIEMDYWKSSKKRLIELPLRHHQ
jgi:hypothetical protein